jgi:hypothetical protein
LHARPSRAALVCGRTGSVGDIDGRFRRQTKSEEEATVRRTFEDRQNGRAGWLTLHITPEMPVAYSAGKLVVENTARSFVFELQGS